MEKPIAKTIQITYYDYNKVIDYIEEKYSIRVRDYAGYLKDLPNERPYLDFWHWIVDNYEIHDGCYVTFTWQEHYDDEDTPEWVKEILSLILKEFPEDLEMYCRVCW